MKVLFLDFTTSLGGVQAVLLHLLNHLNKAFSITYIDAYDSEMTEILRRRQIQVRKASIWPKVKAIGWHRPSRRILALFLLGPSYFFYILRLVKIFREYDCVFISQKKSLVIAQLSNLLARRSIVFHAHGFHSADQITSIYKWAIQRADKIIAVSEDVKRKMIASGIDKTKIQVIYNGIDLTGIDQAEVVSPPQMRCDTFNIFIGCSIQPIKGVHLLVEAVHELRQQGRKVNLFIAGSTPHGGDESYLENMKKYVRKHGLEQEIHFLGWQSDLISIMKTMDVVVLPSLVDESFGLIIAEAMAVHKPVIASNVGGLKELIIHEENGFLVEQGNKNEIVESLGKLMDKQELCEEFGGNGRRRIVENFQIERQVQQVRELLSSLHRRTG
ncbi:glycosyltransferase involved in cell wall biosynthesis [Aneurinibacillus soli]|uniref:D-inositol 3-phosphate glycosyltransferase n=1 Tax=Aneurinibacillus soli TaxID=1500254 RepID=A0A0U5BIT6_9BACL|nr:glycosyltransferase family 4 protein [Aneurinibacillus soli]PYE64145.1 glycosyltransferase involved in cell wall biosynthesis [Aneurinibacillus soli]BAU28094.1 D-inositol 3-phosphate glycosyltransferase [Aneurinibacillus soli]